MAYIISVLSKEFKVTTRTIRYYEEIGLLHPQRDRNGRRIFTKKDYARLKLIFRGKKFGFHLNEIKEMIQLFDKDRTGERQLEKTIKYGKEKIREVDQKISELIVLKQEMESLLSEFEIQLLKKERET